MNIHCEGCGQPMASQKDLVDHVFKGPCPTSISKLNTRAPVQSLLLMDKDFPSVRSLEIALQTILCTPPMLSIFATAAWEQDTVGHQLKRVLRELLHGLDLVDCKPLLYACFIASQSDKEFHSIIDPVFTKDPDHYLELFFLEASQAALPVKKLLRCECAPQNPPKEEPLKLLKIDQIDTWIKNYRDTSYLQSYSGSLIRRMKNQLCTHGEDKCIYGNDACLYNQVSRVELDLQGQPPRVLPVFIGETVGYLDQTELAVKWTTVPFTWSLADLFRGQNEQARHYRLTGVLYKTLRGETAFESVAYITDRTNSAFEDALRKWIRKEAHPVGLIYEVRQGEPILPQINFQDLTERAPLLDDLGMSRKQSESLRKLREDYRGTFYVSPCKCRQGLIPRLRETCTKCPLPNPFYQRDTINKGPTRREFIQRIMQFDSLDPLVLSCLVSQEVQATEEVCDNETQVELEVADSEVQANPIIVDQDVQACPLVNEHEVQATVWMVSNQAGGEDKAELNFKEAQTEAIRSSEAGTQVKPEQQIANVQTYPQVRDSCDQTQRPALDSAPCITQEDMPGIPLSLQKFNSSDSSNFDDCVEESDQPPSLGNYEYSTPQDPYEEASHEIPSMPLEAKIPLDTLNEQSAAVEAIEETPDQGENFMEALSEGKIDKDFCTPGQPEKDDLVVAKEDPAGILNTPGESATPDAEPTGLSQPPPETCPTQQEEEQKLGSSGDSKKSLYKAPSVEEIIRKKAEERMQNPDSLDDSVFNQNQVMSKEDLQAHRVDLPVVQTSKAPEAEERKSTARVGQKMASSYSGTSTFLSKNSSLSVKPSQSSKPTVAQAFFKKCFAQPPQIIPNFLSRKEESKNEAQQKQFNHTDPKPGEIKQEDFRPEDVDEDAPLQGHLPSSTIPDPFFDQSRHFRGDMGS